MLATVLPPMAKCIQDKIYSLYVLHGVVTLEITKREITYKPKDTLYTPGPLMPFEYLDYYIWMRLSHITGPKHI